MSQAKNFKMYTLTGLGLINGYKGPKQRGGGLCGFLQSFADIFGLLRAFTVFCDIFYGLWAFTVFSGFHGFYGLIRPSAVFCGLLRDIPG